MSGAPNKPVGHRELKPMKKRGGRGWTAARRAVLARDHQRCRKCLGATGLDIHHKVERGDGGSDELDNLITLCSDCHCEWTFCEPATLAFDRWLGLPAARFIVPLFAHEWPEDTSARAFKEQLLNAIAVTMYERSYPRTPCP